MNRLTTNGSYCDAIECKAKYIMNCDCITRKLWERLQKYEQAEEQGLLIRLPVVAMIEQSLQNGKMTPQKDQVFNGRYAVVYMDKSKWSTPLIDVCGRPYNKDQAVMRICAMRAEAEAALEAQP